MCAPIPANAALDFRECDEAFLPSPLRISNHFFPLLHTSRPIAGRVIRAVGRITQANCPRVNGPANTSSTSPGRASPYSHAYIAESAATQHINHGIVRGSTRSLHP